MLTPESLFSLKFLRGASLSPDGAHIAYTVSWTDDSEHLEIRVMNRESREQRRLDYSGNAAAPRWSADGRSIAFVADGTLRVARFPELDISPPLTPREMRVDGVPSWAPDSTRIVVSLAEERHTSEGPRRIVDDPFRADGTGFIDALRRNLYVVDITTRSGQLLTSNLAFCSEPQWSRKGDYVLFFATEEPIPFASYSPRLLTINVHTRETTQVLDGQWYVTCARWLPDGDRIAVAAARASTLTVPTLSLWVVDRRGKEASLRTPAINGNVGCRVHHDMPAWDLTQDNSIAVLDDETAIASVQRGGCVELWRISLRDEVRIDPILVGDRVCIVLEPNVESNLLLYAQSSLRSPAELCQCSLMGKEEQRLTELNDEVLAAWPPIEMRSLPFASSDCTPIEAWFLSPKGTTTPLPTVLFIHGGPYISTGHAFRYDFWLLAAQGFGVVFANFRGSAGYGEEFARAIMGDWGGKGFPDHMGAVDAAVSRGFADPERLGVWGASHGGFATCWIIGHTDRFKAAVAEAAVTHFGSCYYLSDAPDGFRRELGGRPHEIPEIYRERSPLTYAHRCATPTLLLHGEDDLRCPISEAEQFFRALRDVGCEAELVRIPQCSHLGDSIGPLSARKAQNEALVGWFSKHL